MSDFIENVITLMEVDPPQHEAVRRNEESYLSFWTAPTGSFSLHWQPGIEDVELRSCDRHVYLTEGEEGILARWIQGQIYDFDRAVFQEQFKRAVDNLKKEEADEQS